MHLVLFMYMQIYYKIKTLKAKFEMAKSFKIMKCLEFGIAQYKILVNQSDTDYGRKKLEAM